MHITTVKATRRFSGPNVKTEHVECSRCGKDGEIASKRKRWWGYVCRECIDGDPWYFSKIKQEAAWATYARNVYRERAAA